jgi:hypothetical protein
MYGWMLRTPQLQGMTLSRRTCFRLTLLAGFALGCLACGLVRSF